MPKGPNKKPRIVRGCFDKDGDFIKVYNAGSDWRETAEELLRLHDREHEKQTAGLVTDEIDGRDDDADPFDDYTEADDVWDQLLGVNSTRTDDDEDRHLDAPELFALNEDRDDDPDDDSDDDDGEARLLEAPEMVFNAEDRDELPARRRRR